MTKPKITYTYPLRDEINKKATEESLKEARAAYWERYRNHQGDRPYRDYDVGDCDQIDED